MRYSIYAVCRPIPLPSKILPAKVQKYIHDAGKQLAWSEVAALQLPDSKSPMCVVRSRQVPGANLPLMQLESGDSARSDTEGFP